MASISVRQSIAWPPVPLSEPTSTIVLTSPQRRFVDVRILLPDGGVPSMADGSLQLSVSATAVPLELEWAHAGTSSSSPVASGTASTSASASRGMWRHWVDSLHEEADFLIDEGLCVEQADGTVLETGEMVNPATGRVAPYEEVWRDIAPLAVTGKDAARPRCVVLQLHDTTKNRNNRGVVQVLGQFCQGISRTAEDGVTVERWQWAAEPSPRWQTIFRQGTGPLPCKAAIESAEELKEGETVTCQGFAWAVVEVADL